MNYALNKASADAQTATGRGGLGALGRLLPLLAKEKRDLAIACVAIVLNAGTSLAVPVIIGRAVDRSIRTGDFAGLLRSSALLLAVYLFGLAAGYTQVIRMGTVGRNVLYDLRNRIFLKLQELPVAFFNQNKVGDLISRINNDTDRLNQFFAQALMQFVGNFFLIVGAGVLLVSLNWRLGLAALAPALGVLVMTRLVSPWVKRKNLESLQSLGGMSAEIQESLDNFKVIVAFNRMEYFRDKFDQVNRRNYTASIGAGLANNVFMPSYALASGLGQLIVLAYGIVLIASGHLTVGLLIGFLLYVNNFYMPLRQLANIWPSLQQSMAAIDRISEILGLSSDMEVMSAEPMSVETSGAAGHVGASAGAAGPAARGGNAPVTHPVIAFHHVTFRYPDSKDVLRRVSFSLHRGKTYALVGPTGGGKTTTASLMARLYDATEGRVTLDGRDIRSYPSAERARRIGFILQEPFLFTGTLIDNLFYGHPDFTAPVSDMAGDPEAGKARRVAALKESGLDALLSHFAQGLETPIRTGGDGISLGQRQLIAFVRAVLRKPDILILDEATANIDTVTEQLLEQALQRLPATTTKVIIAHRLNTIESADEIFFVNGGEVTAAGSLEHAVEMLMHGKRAT